MTNTKKNPFRVLGINHLGIVPKDFAQASDFFQDLLGLGFQGDEDVIDQQTKTRMFRSTSDEAQKEMPPFSRLELLAPMGDEGPIHKYLETKGGGIHHLALDVDDVAAALDYLNSKGVQLIDKTPRTGAHQTLVGFIHPRATGGILVELVQEKTRP